MGRSNNCLLKMRCNEYGRKRLPCERTTHDHSHQTVGCLLHIRCVTYLIDRHGMDLHPVIRMSLIFDSSGPISGRVFVRGSYFEAKEFNPSCIFQHKQDDLRYLCLLVYDGVQHIFCCVEFSLFVFFFLYLVYPMLPVSLDCPFLIASSAALTCMYSLFISTVSNYEISSVVWLIQFSFNHKLHGHVGPPQVTTLSAAVFVHILNPSA